MSGQAAAFQPSGFFALRTPLLPFEELQAVAAADDGAAWLELSSRPDVRDALLVASPSLVDALTRGGDQPTAKALPKLVAYLTRACTRPTPFGLFAGCSTGTFGSATSLQLAPRGEYRRHTRLDNDYLFALLAALETDPSVREALTWTPNSSLYRAGGRWRYAEARLSGTLRTYHLVALDEMDALTTVLEVAAAGATIDDLAGALVDDEVTAEDARAFVEELIDAQVLVSQLQVPVTGESPIDVLVAQLGELQPTKQAADHLDGVRRTLQRVDAAGAGASAADYDDVAAQLTPLPVTPERSRLLQVDMVKPSVDATLGPLVLTELQRAIDVLHRCARPAPDDDPLVAFRAAFTDRYEDAEVPLVEALDEEIGIGFGSDPHAESAPLLEGLGLGSPAAPATTTWGARDEVLLALVMDAARRGDAVLDLDRDTLAALAVADPPALPDALEVTATIAARSGEAVDVGDFQLLVRGVGGAPGARMLGRFCHADPTLRDAVVDHLRREEARRPDAVFAEVVHLPEGRLGNILCRPVLRGFEIPYLGRSGAAPDAQIPVTDLSVAVRGGRVVLRSARLDREVVPRLTTAHNVELRTLGVYRFLCALQNQNVARGLGWSWGPLASAPALPRVTSGRLVLARRRWTLRGEELAALPLDRLPRYVALADGDNELVCDLESSVSLGALRHQLRGRTQVTLVELFPGPDELCVAGPMGHFTHEIVVPFVAATPPAAVSRPATARPLARRAFPPGSEWTYAKLYTGTATADRVLVSAVRPLVDRVLADGVADSWFFIRYSDPHWHVRLRVRGDTAAILDVLHDASEPLLADGRLWRVQLDTYQRELERYGGDAGMELSEQVFRHDSDAVLAIVERLDGDAGLDARWRLAVVGIDRLLDDLGLDLGEKTAWAAARRDAFGREFGVDGAVGGQLGRRYRAERAALEDLMAADGDSAHPLAPGLAILQQRSAALAPVAAELRARALPLADLAGSYAHMHANRLLRAAHRAQELALYDLLHRLYQTRSHRVGRA